MFIETERLILRKFQDSDFDDYCEYAMNDEMNRMMGNVYMRDKETARINFDWLMNKADRCYGLVLKDTGKLIGNLSIGKVSSELAEMDILKGKDGRSLSYCVSWHFQRRGLMYETLTAVIDELFSNEGLDYIYCGYFSFNTPSEILQKKLGFEYLTTSHFEINGESVTAIENVLWNNRK